MRYLSFSSYIAALGISITLFAFAAVAASPQSLRDDPRVLAALKKEGSNASDTRLRAALGLTSEETLEVIRSYPDGQGGTVTRYRQKYQGVPLWGEQIVISKDNTGSVTRLNGRLVAGLARELRQTKPAFSEQTALTNMQQRLRSRMGGAELNYKNKKSELVIYLDKNVPRLSYAVSFFADTITGGRPTRPTFILDALSGQIIFEFEGLTHACNTGCELINQSNLSAGTGTWTYYSVIIEADVAANSQLEVTLSGGSGDADLYLRKGTTNPTTSTYDCGSLSSTNSEQCLVSATAGQQWTIGVYAWSTYSGANLVARVKTLTPASAIGPGGNVKIGKYGYGTSKYGTQYDPLAVTKDGSAGCAMNNANVKTVNLNGGTSGSTAFSFVCYENIIKEINGAYSPLNDAQFFGSVVFNMYGAYVGQPPLTFPLTMRVHYGLNYENAFWDGSSMTFGDGASTFYPLVSLDVSAHEVSHGFTEQNSNLIYSGESGGINEAFSDIAGEAAEFFMRGSGDFLVGADIMKSGSALRDMCNPPADGASINHVSKYYSGLDVHYSSGIYNKVFCTLAKTPTWTIEKAFKSFARANQLYWTASTGFKSGAQDVVDASFDLGYNYQDVINAFTVVGISGLGGPVVPNAPSGFTATALSSSSIRVSWTDTVGETGYTLERSSDGTNYAVIVNPLNDVTAYQDSGLLPSTIYYYRLKAWNRWGSSVYSERASATTQPPPPPPPSAPTNLNKTLVTRNSISLSWIDNANNETGFKLERSTNGTTWPQITTLTQNATSATSTGLKSNTVYYFRVRAYNSSGNSAYSNIFSVRTTR